MENFERLEAKTQRHISGGRILAAGDPRLHAEELSVLNERFPQKAEQLSASTDNP